MIFSGLFSKGLRPLALIFILAVLLRLVAPICFYAQKTDPFPYMIASYSNILMVFTMDIAAGNDFTQWHHGLIQNALIPVGRLPYALVSSVPVLFFSTPDKTMPGIDVGEYEAGVRELPFSAMAAVMVFQGIMDAFGCFFIYCLLRLYYPRKTGLIGALIYAFWLPSIFYAYHFLETAYVPVTLLLACLAFCLALEKKKWRWYGLAGFCMGLVLLVRIDNALILPAACLYALWANREPWKNRAAKLLFLFFAALTLYTLVIGGIEKGLDASPGQDARPSYLAKAQYSLLGEYPGTYKGLRFFLDEYSNFYVTKKMVHYLEKEDPVFLFMARLYAGDLGLLTYVKEVIIEKPILYADRAIRRFVVYFPAVPAFGGIAYFFSKSPEAWKTMLGYRYSQVFQGAKYFDYLLFGLFLWGLWIARKTSMGPALFCIYLGVLIGHVFTACGESYFRMEREVAFLNPKYLLGMISIWPVFIAVWASHIAAMRGKAGEKTGPA